MQSEQIKQKILSNLICSQLLTEQLEELSTTELFRRKIKSLTKQLIPELENVLKQYNKMYMTDEEVSRMIVYEYEKAIKILAQFDIRDFVLFSQFLEVAAIDRNKLEEKLHEIIKDSN